MSEDGSEHSLAPSSSNVATSNEGTQTGTTGQTNTSSSSSEEWAARERKNVTRTKYFVVGLLFASAIVCGWFTYFVMIKQQSKFFERTFKDYAMMISDSIEGHAVFIAREVENFANIVTAYSQAKGDEWPYVVIPDWEPRGSQINSIIGSTMVNLAPFVDDMQKWNEFTEANQDWIQDGIEYQNAQRRNLEQNGPVVPRQVYEYVDEEYNMDLPNSTFFPDSNGASTLFLGEKYLPSWQVAPAPQDSGSVNLDLLSHPAFRPYIISMMESNKAVLSPVLHADSIDPHNSVLLQPVYGRLDQKNQSDIVGVLLAYLPWENFLDNLLPGGIESVILVVDNSCGYTSSYQVDGSETTYLGQGSLQEQRYNDVVAIIAFSLFGNEGVTTESSSKCAYYLNIYPSRDLETSMQTSTPILYTVIVVFVFVATTVTFSIYDYYVSERQAAETRLAQKSNAIVSSLFPSKVRDRIMKEAEAQVNAEMRGFGGGRGTTGKLKSFLYDGNAKDINNNANHSQNDISGHAIADRYAECTVMYADIAGFTAWSSIREATQVFQLLETLYHAFDEVASRRRIFKVETIGDCYVAVAGVPEPRKDHAIAMCRFANDINRKMAELTNKLEDVLGLDTSDLKLRIGLHSGPVTAGVIRGEKSRFQLFGSTVDKAADMESSGVSNRIQVSQATADLVMKSEKSAWLEPRKKKDEDEGEPTYWINVKVRASPSVRSGASTEDSASAAISSEPTKPFMNSTPETDSRGHVLSEKIRKLVTWNSDNLLHLLRLVVLARDANQLPEKELSNSSLAASQDTADQQTIDEVKDVITLPKCRSTKASQACVSGQVDEKIETQLRDFVSIIASFYHESNPFHNFEHATHVCMSVNKLMSRIVAPDHILDSEVDSEDDLIKNLHDHTYGITSDPLTQFAVVFAALIHDVDHSGVPNAQLVKENAPLATLYKNQTVAEQNSVDISWELLMDSSFADLRAAICATPAEMKRFRQLVVNSVIATDIADKRLMEQRNARWAKAFKQNECPDLVEEETPQHQVNRKATIVIEHLIQASDISHTMQHWKVYRKWNEKLFAELRLAHRSGRAEKDPSEFWYKGELGFYDFYIIPLAKKLKDCGVFGVSSDEYLHFAQMNRKEWELKGEAAVEELSEKYKDLQPVGK